MVNDKFGPTGKVVEWLEPNNLARKPSIFWRGSNKNYSVSFP